MCLPCHLVSQAPYEDEEFARYQRLTVVHWCKVLGNPGFTELCILNDVKSGLLKSYLPLVKDLHKKRTVTTIDWSRLSSKSELYDRSLTTEITHNTVMLCWEKKKRIHIMKVKQCFLFLYTCKNVVSVHSNDRQFQKGVDII